MNSIWKETASLPHFSPLSAHSPVDVAVIGGGLAGLLCAYQLQKAGLSVLVLEANRIGSGQTEGTTAKITSQHGLFYDRLIRQAGYEAASLYAEANEQAIDSYLTLIQELQIACDFERLPSYLYTTRSPELLIQEWRAARRLGLPASLTTRTSLPFSVSLALRFDHQAAFHPLRFLAALASQLPVYENTEVLKVQGNRLITSQGCLSARNIVFACHYPFVNFPGLFFLRMHQERSYCLAIKGAPAPDGLYYGIDKGALSLRGYKDAVILGGGGHRCGENPSGGRYALLRRAAEKNWPGCTPFAQWSAQDCMTPDHLPYIGRFSSRTPSWYVCTGFGKWGMTLSMVAAGLLTDIISCRSNPLEKLFSPHRSLSAPAVPTLASEIGHAVKGLGRTVLPLFLPSPSSIKPGHGGIVRYHGKPAGLYRTPEGKCFLVQPRCPHLGCRLEWNPDERSWDCPCHGSRFSYDGTLLSGPAQSSLSRLH